MNILPDSAMLSSLFNASSCFFHLALLSFSFCSWSFCFSLSSYLVTNICFPSAIVETKNSWNRKRFVVYIDSDIDT